MNPYEKLNLCLYGLQSVVLVVVLVIYAKQLTAMRQQVEAGRGASAAQNLLALMEFLQSENVREARRFVIQTLDGRPLVDWNDDEKRVAATVCSSYGVAGMLLESGIAPAEAVIENWGPSIRRCYKILSGFIREMQGSGNNGPGYWATFDRLAARAERGSKK